MECKLNNLTIYYETLGEVGGIPLVMIHGGGVDHHHCVSDMEPLFSQRKGWRRIYFDAPGMGKSPSAAWIDSYDAMLEVIIDFLDHVIPGQRFVLGGVSWGGWMARGVAYRRGGQMDGLFLLVPTIKNDPEKDRIPPHVTLVEDPQLLAELSEEDRKFMGGFAVVQSRELLDSIRRDIIPAIERADKEFLERFFPTRFFSFDPDVLPTPFAAPTLILTGRQDSSCGYYDAFQILDNYPRATFAALDRAGHGLGIEQKRLLQSLANEWLDRVEEYVKGRANSF